MTRSLFIAYLTGAGGSATALYYLGDGIIAGVDAGGTKYEGAFEIGLDGAYSGTISYAIPHSVLLLTGQTATQEQKVEFALKLPANFWDGRVIRMETPLGPVNARFEKLKDLP